MTLHKRIRAKYFLVCVMYLYYSEGSWKLQCVVSGIKESLNIGHDDLAYAYPNQALPGVCQVYNLLRR